MTLIFINANYTCLIILYEIDMVSTDKSKRFNFNVLPPWCKRIEKHLRRLTFNLIKIIKTVWEYEKNHLTETNNYKGLHMLEKVMFEIHILIEIRFIRDFFFPSFEMRSSICNILLCFIHWKEVRAIFQDPRLLLF